MNATTKINHTLTKIAREALEKSGVKLNTRRGGRIRTDKQKDGSYRCKISWVKSNFPEEASKFLPNGYKFITIPSTNKSNTWELVTTE